MNAKYRAKLRASTNATSTVIALCDQADRYEAALKRISDMSVRPACICGTPTGTGAIKMCADTALNHDSEESK